MFRGLARLCLRSRLTYRFRRCYERGSTTHIVARIRVWLEVTCDGIGYYFERIVRVAALHFGFPR